MHPKRLLLRGVLPLVMVAAACGGAEPTPAECFAPVDGQLVPVPCEDGEDTATPTPTFTPPPPLTPSCPDDGSPEAFGCELFLVPPGGCSACHAIDGLAFGQIGPDLTRIGAMGEAYIRESIANPNAVIADVCPTGPCQPDVMPQDFGTALTAEQLNAVVALLLTLK